MLHIEYAESDYKGTRIDIQPGNVSEIPGLKDIVNHNLIIENPARTFARKMKNGGYEGWGEEDLATEAEVANVISDLWDSEPGMNAIMLLSRALQTVVNLTQTNDIKKRIRI